jgi:hypothetical protein
MVFADKTFHVINNSRNWPKIKILTIKFFPRNILTNSNELQIFHSLREITNKFRIRIQDILACSFLDDLLELRDEELSQELQDSNWFSASSVLRIYGNYLNLDRDHNGMLSRQELQKYGTGSLSPGRIY